MRAATHVVANQNIPDHEIQDAIRKKLPVVKIGFVDEYVKNRFLPEEHRFTVAAFETALRQFSDQGQGFEYLQSRNDRLVAYQPAQEADDDEEELDSKSFRFIPKPSKPFSPQVFEASDVSNRIHPIWSPICWGFYQAVHSAQEDLPEATVFSQAMAAFLQAHDRIARASQELKDTVVALFVAALNKALGRRADCDLYYVLAQYALRYGQFLCKIDVAITMLHGPAVVPSPDPQLPIVFEFKIASTVSVEEAHHQLARYCSNLAFLTAVPHFLAIVLLFDPETPGSVNCDARLLVASKKKTAAYAKFMPTQICSGSIAWSTLISAIAQTLSGLRGVEFSQRSLRTKKHIRLPAGVSPTVGCHMVGNQQMAVKVFQNTTRRANVSARMIDNASLVLDVRPEEPTDRIQVLTYPWIEGDIYPDKLFGNQLSSAAKELKNLYEQGLAAHGDIRFANLIFTPAGGAKWIDFDYSVLVGDTRNYPPSWNLLLTDTTRHPDVQPGAEISRAHDLYSFVAMMGKYQPDDISQRDDWEQASTPSPDQISIDEVIARLERYKSLQLSKKRNDLSRPDTGSNQIAK